LEGITDFNMLADALEDNKYYDELFNATLEAIKTYCNNINPDVITFDDFALKFNKTYASEEERTYRKGIYQQNVKVIIATNKTKNATFYTGVN